MQNGKLTETGIVIKYSGGCVIAQISTVLHAQTPELHLWNQKCVIRQAGRLLNLPECEFCW